MNTAKAAAIEAVLFAAGDAVETERIAAAVEITKEEAEEILADMEICYASEERGIRLVRLENAWQFLTKNEYYDALIRLEISAKKPKLTEALLETLSIVAYKQPVTRLEIEKIRGVRSDHAVSRLIEFDLVKELGRLDAPGRPVLLGTTEAFLRCFGLSEKADLPQMDPVKAEDFRAEAESEAGAEEPAPENIGNNDEENGPILQKIVD